ncbi:MAG: DNA helicase II [Steroidobacteraceae bacterium]|nr:DNA helicase II [Steroidobacteraceae bacterium]
MIGQTVTRDNLAGGRMRRAIVYCTVMPQPTHLEKLNAAQRQAVTWGEPRGAQGFRSGPLLIIAGAGTGKTNTLAHRVAHLALHGVDPARILMLTFTRRAALEMRRRAHEIAKAALNETLGGVGQAIAQRLGWAGTFHSIGNRLLRHYAPQLALDPQFSVMDRADAADLIDGLRHELGYTRKEQRFPRKDTCLAIYSYRVNTQKSLKETLEQQYPWCLSWEEDLAKLFRTYVERKQKFAILDYDDLLLYWHVLMSEPALAQHVGTHFDHVLVDEFQDTNRLQAEILYRLTPQGEGLTVVGDDAQAIYSFRAATVENILGFPARFSPPAEIVKLAQNYRSTQAVLDVSNALMAEAPKQFRKHLLSLRGVGSRPRLVAVDDLPTQAEYVCTQVLKAREANVPLRRQAVLFRSASHSDLLEIELSKRKIPFIKYGGLKFLEAAHVKDLIAILRWIDNPRNAMAGFRVLQLLKGMGPANARRALDHLVNEGGSFTALRTFEPPAECAIDWKKLVELVVTLGDPQLPWPGQVNQVRTWYRPHLERLYEHVHTRIGDLDQLELLSGQYPSRERFITELTLDPPQASGDLAGQPLLDEDYLVLSTVHSAKGMEWDTVYVLNVVDGSFPSEFATGHTETIEEERRLLYVAMTRAREDLHLVQPLRFPLTQQPKQGDAHVYGGRSRFMTDKVLKALDSVSFQGARLSDAPLADAGQAALDAAQRIKNMW